MADETLNGGCPSETALKSFVADPIRNENEAVASHVYVCECCQRRVESLLYPASESALTDEEKGAISAFAQTHFEKGQTMRERLEAFVAKRQMQFFSPSSEGEWRMAAAANGAARKPASASEDVKFVFASDDGVGPGEVWRAELDIPGSATGTDLLKISIRDKDGQFVGDGLFTIAGTTLIVESGRSAIPFNNFLVGIRNSAVAYQRAGGAAVTGNLVFF